MTIAVEAIKFNHDPTSASHDALNIRRNLAQLVEVPEWRRGLSVRPEDSVAAYAISEVGGNQLTVHASFSRSGEGGPEILYIRAVDASGPLPQEQGCLGLIIRFLVLLHQLVAGNVLGEAKARSVLFGPDGQTGFVSFDLAKVRLATFGIGARTTTWRWQYRAATRGPWTDFASTSHRIYSVLDVPTAPWVQAPFEPANTQLPWTEVLDYACKWAVLKSTPDDAAAGVTQAVYDLGSGPITYDCPGGGGTNYGGDCTAFLERLAGGLGHGYYVNCSDCATFVSTFANALGCDLWQSQMDFFDLNELRPIGATTWGTPCGWTYFSYHEVAWKGACDVDDAVFDACLAIDGDADPLSAPHSFLLPVNLRFGRPGDGDYRDRVATPPTRPSCAPLPFTRSRRPVY